MIKRIPCTVWKISCIWVRFAAECGCQISFRTPRCVFSWHSLRMPLYQKQIPQRGSEMKSDKVNNIWWGPACKHACLPHQLEQKRWSLGAQQTKEHKYRNNHTQTAQRRDASCIMQREMNFNKIPLTYRASQRVHHTNTAKHTHNGSKAQLKRLQTQA